jgi:hypothetical protein
MSCRAINRESWTTNPPCIDMVVMYSTERREFPAAARKYHVTKEVLQYRYRFLLDGLKEGRVNLGTGEVSRKTAFALG